MKRLAPATPRLPVAAVVVASAAMATLLALPTLVLLARAFAPPGAAPFLPPAALEALRLSLLTTGASLALVVLFGTPLAYGLARFRFRGKAPLEALLDLPLVLPPVVAGVALLLVAGRRGVLGAPLGELGLRLAFTSAAVVLAQVFVAAPLYVRSMKAAFRGVPPELEQAALTLHAGRRRAFLRVTLPLTGPGFVEGCVLAWTRALGEFGATLVVAGSLAGRTRTLPLAIYTELESDLDAALAMSGLLALTAFALLLAFRGALSGRGARRG